MSHNTEKDTLVSERKTTVYLWTNVFYSVFYIATQKRPFHILGCEYRITEINRDVGSSVFRITCELVENEKPKENEELKKFDSKITVPYSKEKWDFWGEYIESKQPLTILDESYCVNERTFRDNHIEIDLIWIRKNYE